MTLATILTIVGGLIGIGGTVLAYKLNPKQKIYDQIDQISKQRVQLKKERDIALAKNDSIGLTISGNELIELQNTEAKLLQRLRDINTGK